MTTPNRTHRGYDYARTRSPASPRPTSTASADPAAAATCSSCRPTRRTPRGPATGTYAQNSRTTPRTRTPATTRSACRHRRGTITRRGDHRHPHRPGAVHVPAGRQASLVARPAQQLHPPHRLRVDVTKLDDGRAGCSAAIAGTSTATTTAVLRRRPPSGDHRQTWGDDELGTPPHQAGTDTGAVVDFDSPRASRSASRSRSRRSAPSRPESTWPPRRAIASSRCARTRRPTGTRSWAASPSPRLRRATPTATCRSCSTRTCTGCSAADERDEHERHLPGPRRRDPPGRRIHALRRLGHLGRLPQVRGPRHRLPGGVPRHGAVARRPLRRRRETRQGSLSSPMHSVPTVRFERCRDRDRRCRLQGRAPRPAREAYPALVATSNAYTRRASRTATSRTIPDDRGGVRRQALATIADALGKTDDAASYAARSATTRTSSSGAWTADDGTPARSLPQRRRQLANATRAVRGRQPLPGHALAVQLVPLRGHGRHDRPPWAARTRRSRRSATCSASRHPTTARACCTRTPTRSTCRRPTSSTTSVSRRRPRTGCATSTPRRHGTDTSPPGPTARTAGGSGELTPPIKTKVYKNDPQGFLPTMDNDTGAMSATFVAAALGLYPVRRARRVPDRHAVLPARRITTPPARRSASVATASRRTTTTSRSPSSTARPSATPGSTTTSWPER